MIRKDADPDWDLNTSDKCEAFETVKRKLVTPPILGLPKANHPCMIDTDASAYQLGATLLQQQNEQERNEWTTIGYWSKRLMNCERNYSTTERECFSVAWTFTTISCMANARTAQRLHKATRRFDPTRRYDTPGNASTVKTGLVHTDTSDTTTNQMRRLRILGPYGWTVENRKTTFARDRTVPCAMKRRQDLRNRPQRSYRTH